MTDASATPATFTPDDAGAASARGWAAVLAPQGHEGQVAAAIVDAVHDLMFAVAVEPGGVFRVIAVNAAYRRATGLAAEQLVGRRVEDILPEPACAWARARYAEAIARRAAVRYEEDISLGGGRLLLETTLTPVINAEGRCTHLVGAARDVAPRRELEERLRQALKMEAVGRLAGGIAHDFNNLLTAIRCNVQLAADGLDPQHPVRDDVAQISEAADRAAALTRQLLAFSRRQLLQPVALDLNRVVRDMERMLRRIVTVQGPHITIETALATDLGPVLADLVQMQQVLLNLAVNARDAMADSGALLIATSNTTLHAPDPHRHGVVPPGEYVTLVVRDTGRGMDAETLDQLFEPFFTTKGAGTGLGLSTVQGIVQQTGGHVVVQSEPGVGTTFTLHFPRLRTGDASTPPERTPRASMVLVVDPDESIRGVAARVLRRSGCVVREAPNADSALTILDRMLATGTGPDVVLVDLVMPDVDGQPLGDIVRERHPRCEVLYMSGCDEGLAAATRSGVPGSAVLAKPFAPAQLEAAVSAAIGRHHSPDHA